MDTRKEFELDPYYRSESTNELSGLKDEYGERLSGNGSSSHRPEFRRKFWRLSFKQQFMNFESSGIPACVFYYSKGHWKEFCQDLIPSINENFEARNRSLRFVIADNVYILNFVYMLQLNIQTGFVRSIAWIDRSGQCFIPSTRIESSCSRLLLNNLYGREQVAAGEHANFYESNSVPFRSDICSARCGLPINCNDVAGLRDKLDKVVENEQDYCFTRKMFLSGFFLSAEDVSISGIYRISQTGICGQARLQVFNMQEEMTARMRGSANVRYAWHGASKNEVLSIVQHGFGQPTMPRKGDAFGVGIYLAPENDSRLSAMYSEVDENGEQHVILCKAIMGRVEQVLPGCQSFSPSSEDFDTGVDDLTNPRLHIIWSTHMSRHILPLFVISFKLSNIAQERMTVARRHSQDIQDFSTLLTSSEAINVGDVADTSVSIDSDCTCVGERKPLQSSQAVLDTCVSIPSISTSITHGEISYLTPECQLSGLQTDSCTTTLSFIHDVTKGSCTSSNLIKCGASMNELEDTCSSESRCHNGPRSPWISFPELFPLLESKLEPERMIVLRKLHAKFKDGRLPRNMFVKMMRRMLGDEFLRECIMNKPINGVSASGTHRQRIKSKLVKSVFTCGTHSFCR